MKNTMKIMAFIWLILLQNYLPAQDKLNIKFGKISPADFDLSKYKYDSGAAAVIMADIGNTEFIGNTKGDMTLVFKEYKRIKLLRKEGFDLAKEEILVYRDGESEERMSDLRAVTYNLENGQVVQTKMDEKSIFTDKLNRYYSKKKFTLPAVKEGSIIEIEYTIKSDFYGNLRSWNFQGSYPCLWSDYQVSIPSFFHYVKLTQGDQNFFINTARTDQTMYTIYESNGGAGKDDIYNITTDVNVVRWVKKDVPALKEESYTSTIANFVSRIEFQLNYYQFNQAGDRHDVMGNWYMASEKLLKDPSFGGALDDDNRWMSEELKTITTGSMDSLDRIKRIYSFFRDNFTCTDYDEKYAQHSLKTVFKNKNGNVAEINLLLTAMLRHEKITADPVLLSTRDNGYPSQIYPLMSKFNYVICAVTSDGKKYYLDASRPRIGFGLLPADCYNGMARTINSERPYVVFFYPDSLRESKTTTVIIINDDKGYQSGSFQSLIGQNESLDLRERIKKKSVTTYFKDIQSGYGSDFEIMNAGIDSLTLVDNPVKVRYEFNFKPSSNENIIYFNPMMSEAYKNNPFVSQNRTYPVEMPYCSEETYNLNMEIPVGYEVEELPKSVRVTLNQGDGSFEYLLQKTESAVMMRCHLKLNKATFEPDEYNTLRDFFAFIVKKQGEQIVFMKKK